MGPTFLQQANTSFELEFDATALILMFSRLIGSSQISCVAKYLLDLDKQRKILKGTLCHRFSEWPYQTNFYPQSTTCQNSWMTEFGHQVPTMSYSLSSKGNQHKWYTIW